MHCFCDIFGTLSARGCRHDRFSGVCSEFSEPLVDMFEKVDLFEVELVELFEKVDLA